MTTEPSNYEEEQAGWYDDECPDCHGTGLEDGEPCLFCYGEGFVSGAP